MIIASKCINSPETKMSNVDRNFANLFSEYFENSLQELEFSK